MKTFGVSIGAKRIGNPGSVQFSVLASADKVSETAEITVEARNSQSAAKKGLSLAEAKWPKKKMWYGHYANIK